MFYMLMVHALALASSQTHPSAFSCPHNNICACVDDGYYTIEGGFVLHEARCNTTVTAGTVNHTATIADTGVDPF